MFDWIVSVVSGAGLAGVALLMFVENVFPPIPSELIMPLAGFNAARGEMSLVGVILAGTAGSVAGALFWYWIGRAVGLNAVKRLAGRHGRWLTVTPDDVDRACGWFDGHRGRAVFFGRLIPTVRTFISVPAGVTRLSLPVFLVWTALGTAVWTTFLTLAGYVLESQYEKVSDWMNPVSTAILALFFGWYVWRVVTHRDADA